MKLHLYEFRHPKFDQALPEEDIDDFPLIYVITSTPSIDEIRECYNMWDSGDIPYENFAETFKVGKCREITSLADLEGVRQPRWISRYETAADIIPYDTDERVYCEELGGDYLHLDISIGQFLDEYYGKEYPDETWTGMQLMLRRCIVELENNAAVFLNEAGVWEMNWPHSGEGKATVLRKWAKESQAVADAAKQVLEDSRKK